MIAFLRSAIFIKLMESFGNDCISKKYCWLKNVGNFCTD